MMCKIPVEDALNSNKHKTYDLIKTNGYKSLSSFFVKYDKTSIMNTKFLFVPFPLQHNIPLALLTLKVTQKYGMQVQPLH